jgi:hypothetical protein
MHEEATDVDDHPRARSRLGFRPGFHHDDRQVQDNDHRQHPQEGRKENYDEEDDEGKNKLLRQEFYSGEVNFTSLFPVESGPAGPLSAFTPFRSHQDPIMVS